MWTSEGEEREHPDAVRHARGRWLADCEDAFNVIAEYNAAPGRITSEPVALSGQWRCAALNEGSDPGVGCAQGPAGSDPTHGLYLETEPGDVP